MKQQILSFADADERLDELLSTLFQGSYEKVLLIAGDVKIAGPFLKGVKKGKYDLIVITGNLTVDGRIQLYDDTPGLFVQGITKGETLEGGDAEVYLNGGTFAHFVYGYYNHGTLDTGKVQVPWVINSDHDLRFVAGKGTKSIDNHGDDDNYDFGSESIEQSFVADVRGTGDDIASIDIEKFYKVLAAGKPVLVSGSKTAKQKTLAQVRTAKKAQNTELVVTKKLKAFPADALKMPWLKKLVIESCPIKKVPEGIGTLTELEELTLKDCDLATLPASIGKLTKLRVLNIAGNTAIEIPDAIGKLTNLEELDISDIGEPIEGNGLPGMKPTELPASIRKLTKLRVLRADSVNLVDAPDSLPIEVLSMEGSTWAHLIVFPAWIVKLAKLKELHIGTNFYRSIPDLSALKELEVLKLNGALPLVAKLPKLSLPKLRELDLAGHSPHTGVADPPLVLMRGFFDWKLPALEQLALDRWGNGPKDPPRGKVDISGLGKFKTLKSLDLQWNNLETLPDDFYELTNLEQLDAYGYSTLNAKTLAKLKKALPKLVVRTES